METEIRCKCQPVKFSTKLSYPQSRHKHASCVLDNHVYMFAGKDGNISLKDFWRFSSLTLKWDKICYHGDAPQHLEGHSLVAYKKLLLLFGGELGDSLLESSLWIINPDLGYIRRSSLDPGAAFPRVRRDHTAVVYDGCMYIYGGHNDVWGSSSEFWRYHVEDEEWELISPRQQDTPRGRYGHSCVVYNKHMWLYGGHADLVPKQDLWTYSFGTNRWERLKYKYGPPQLTGHTAVVVGSQMILYGGQCNREPVNQMWSFSFKTEKWTQVTLKDNIPCSRTFHNMVLISPTHDTAVKASSMPYLQKKMKQLNLERPRSSPGVRSESNKGLSESNSPRSFDQSASNERLEIFTTSSERSSNVSKITPPQVLTLCNTNSEENLKVFSSPAENTEDKSPLVPKRTDFNYNAINVLDRNAVNSGIDNPGISKSTEELINENRLRLKLLNEGVLYESYNPSVLSQPNFDRSVSYTAEIDNHPHKPFYRQNTDNSISITTNHLVNDLDNQHTSVKRCKLDHDLVLEDLENQDCFPNKIEIPYPKSNCSKFRNYLSSESLLAVDESDDLDSIRLRDFPPRMRSKSACNIEHNSSSQNNMDCVRFNNKTEQVDVNLEYKTLRRCCHIDKNSCNCDQNQREVRHVNSSQVQREIIPETMETSFQCLPLGYKSNGRYTKHKTTTTTERPYMLILGGKDSQITSFSIKPLPVWRLELA